MAGTAGGGENITLLNTFAAEKMAEEGVGVGYGVGKVEEEDVKGYGVGQREGTGVGGEAVTPGGNDVLEEGDLMGVSPYWVNQTGKGSRLAGVVPLARPPPGIVIEGGGNNEGN